MKFKGYLWILGVIILGTLGSALWDAIKPLLGLGTRLILNISTLGIQTLKNNIYKDTAKGFHEMASLELYGFFMILLASFVILVSIALFISIRKLNQVETGKVTRAPLTKNKISGLTKFLTSNKMVTVLLLYSIFVAVFLVLTMVRTEYINNAVTHYEQLYDMTAPYISEDGRLIIKSKFVQIESKEDYELVINKLISVAQNKNLTYSEFSIY